MTNLLWFSYSSVTYRNLLEAPPRHQIFICWIYFYITNWQNMEATALTITLDTIKIEPFLAKNLRAQNLFWCKSKILSNAWVVAWQLKVPCWKVPSIGFAQRERHLHFKWSFVTHDELLRFAYCWTFIWFPPILGGICNNYWNHVFFSQSKVLVCKRKSILNFNIKVQCLEYCEKNLHANIKKTSLNCRTTIKQTSLVQINFNHLLY
jgi:hypothetical protein